MENLLWKKANTIEQQLELDFTGNADVQVTCDETCYTIKDIATYLQNKFCGQKNVPFIDVWKILEWASYISKWWF